MNLTNYYLDRIETGKGKEGRRPLSGRKGDVQRFCDPTNRGETRSKADVGFEDRVAFSSFRIRRMACRLVCRHEGRGVRRTPIRTCSLGL